MSDQRPNRVILFDIDNTLLFTGGAGGLAMNQAFQDMFGVQDGFAKVEFSGRTDLYILAEGLKHHGIKGDLGDHLRPFLDRYYALLRGTIRERNGHLMPGFPHLLESIAQRDGVSLGLATGNFSEAARIKLEHYGLAKYFERDGQGLAGAFGEQSTDRSEMLKATLSQLTDDIDPAEVLVVGDTPHDVKSALDNRLTPVGVATGTYSVDQLRESGARLLFQDFSDWQSAAATLSGES